MVNPTTANAIGGCRLGMSRASVMVRVVTMEISKRLSARRGNEIVNSEVVEKMPVAGFV
jgi:hypothetical protein